MLGIEEIATYIPDKKISNYDKKSKFNMNEDFIENKLGIRSHTVKENNEKSSDLCVKAYSKLIDKNSLNKEEIDCCIVVTQNPDYNIPHTSAVLHGKLGLGNNCACFDISLGCSGYVYGLSNIISFMEFNNLKKGLLFTSDQYSEIIDKDDKNTDVIFGDAASVTLISNNYSWELKSTKFGTNGSLHGELICEDKLYMNGRAVFNFTATTVPKHIEKTLEENNLSKNDIDKFIFHQGSKFIVDTITKRLKLDPKDVPFDIYEYGNTISSSIPIILEKHKDDLNNNRILTSAFGVGLSWATSILERKKG